MPSDDEDRRLRSVALQNVQTILQARQRAEQDLLRTKEALEEEKRVLELLNRTGASLASKLDLASVLQAVTDAATELGGAQFGAFVRAGREGDVYSSVTASGDAREAFEAFGDPRQAPVLAPAFRGEGLVRLADVHEPPIYSLLAAPVTNRDGEIIGVLLLGHRDRNVFSDRTERVVVAIAAQAALAIDNARLYEDARRSADDRAALLAAERAARAELERVSMMKDEFLATLSHELRTPLSAVLGWSKILLARNPGESDLRRGLETIARNARAQAQLIEDLLDMNRIVSGKIRLDVQPVEIASIVDAAIDSVRPSADAKEIVLRTMIDPRPGPVFGDPNRLQQIVWNLLTNAVKFTPKRGKIDVILQRVNSHIEISGHDSGMGISPEFLPYLFERFRQADASTTRKHGGLGLGLSIVKQLVELHGGTVTAESEGSERGAMFTVCLPVRAVRDVGEPREHPRTDWAAPVLTPELSLAGITVLVIDDEADARELLRSVLTDAAAHVLTAASAEEALPLVSQARPDVIVSDIGMPDRDGYQFMRDVRGLPFAAGGKTPAIALTAFARSEDRTRAMLAGYQVHVSKPIEPQELVATIKSLVANRGDRD
jgi:signal transduction histidine kinase/ActR/RegA family two-component response regulator